MRNLRKIGLGASLITVLVAVWAGPALAYSIPPVTGTRLTFSAQQTLPAYYLPPTVVHRQPAYGYYPASCLVIKATWTSYYDTNDGFLKGTTFAEARDVVDNGSCSGPLVNNSITVWVRPWFWGYYGNEEAGQYAGCQTGAQGPFGITGAGINSTCAQHPTYNGPFGDWKRGYESLELQARTDHYAWGPTVVTSARLT